MGFRLGAEEVTQLFLISRPAVTVEELHGFKLGLVESLFGIAGPQMQVSQTVETVDGLCWPRFVRSIPELKTASPKPHLLSSLMPLKQGLHSVRSQLLPYPLLP